MTITESQDALAYLAWQVELGADEAILDAPVNRLEAVEMAILVPSTLAKAVQAPQTAPPVAKTPDKAATAAAAVSHAQALAAAAGSLAQLRNALAGFEACDLRHGARNLVFSDGNPEARVMIIGEAPGREEDIQGRPFVGRAGQLLDRMFAAIGLSRTDERADSALYITNVVPWRPPQNRDPNGTEIAMLRPFMERHVALAAPDLVILMGNISCEAGLGRRGITRLRGQWAEAYGKPALPMFHPAYLLRNPAAKREAWADLLALRARLGRSGG